MRITLMPRRHADHVNEAADADHDHAGEEHGPADHEDHDHAESDA